MDTTSSPSSSMSIGVNVSCNGLDNLSRMIRANTAPSNSGSVMTLKLSLSDEFLHLDLSQTGKKC